MPGLLAVTKVLQIVASIGVAKVVTSAIENTVRGATPGMLAKAAHWTGGLVIGSMAVEQANKHIERVVNKVAEDYEEQKKKTEEGKESTEK